METKENIKVSAIEKELLALKGSSFQKNLISACLFNLIIYTHESHRVDYFRKLVLRIIEKLPCRIIFIQATTNLGEGELSVSVSTETAGEGDLKISCDQITLKVAGKYISRIPFIILPHLTPDLPIYLLWGQDPNRESEILPNLERFATSIIFDAESCDSLPHFCQAILKKMNTLKINMIDMNWAKISGWREILFKTFESSEKINQLAQSKMIQITYQMLPQEKICHQETQSFFLQAWLAAQLNWKYTSQQIEGNILRMTYKNINGNPLIIDLCPKNVKELTPGSIISFESITEDNHFITLSRNETSPAVTVSTSSKETCEIPYTFILPSHQRGPNFVKELFFASDTDHYPKMLEVIAQM